MQSRVELEVRRRVGIETAGRRFNVEESGADDY
jgi:hypothetical protein